jgi:hypothetical protein
MRTAGLLTIALAASTITISDAGAGPWCAMFTRGSENCGYSSFEQCRAAVSGLPAFCQQNPYPGTNFGRGTSGYSDTSRRYRADR